MVFVFKSILGIFVNYVIVRFSEAQQVRLRSQLMMSYQSLKYTTYLRRNSSEYMRSSQVLVTQFAQGVIFAGMKTLSEMIVAIVILSFLAWTSPIAFSILMLLLVMFLSVYDLVFRRKVKSYGEKRNVSSKKLVQAISEGLEGLKNIRVLKRESFFYNKVVESTKEIANYNIKSTLISTSNRYLLELLMVLFVVLLVFITLMSKSGSEQMIPILGIFGVAAIRLLPAANKLSISIMNLRLHRNTVEILSKDVIEFGSIHNHSSKKSTASESCEEFVSFCIDNVSFRYPSTNKKALNQLCLDFNRGDSIGLIGVSGSGKTTLVDLLLGLLVPQEGKVTYNGKSLDKNLDSWLSHVAYISQQVFLTDDTLRRNIAFGIEDKSIDETRVKECLARASLAELVNDLPEGIDTFVGERGVRLSGGQRQRVALARAFYYSRDVLIMDESTSALDNETEAEIVKEIKSLKGKITMVVISHRHSTVMHCDRIYKIEKGKIIAFGSPQEMLKSNNTKVL
jgi:ABC-type multidrug transport system fused ATPase/permease subunit